MSVQPMSEPKSSTKKKKPTTPPKEKTVDSPWGEKDGKRVRTGKRLPFENRLSEFFATIAGVSAIAGDTFTANVIEAKTEELAYGYAKLAQSDPRVKRVLSMMMEGSAWSEALIPTVGLVVMVGWHYGVIPDRLGLPITMANGVMPVTRGQEMQMRAQAARDQQEAEAAAAARSQQDNNGAGI